MVKVLGIVLRMLLGIVLASLTAGLIQVLFAVTPAELMRAPDDRLDEAGIWVLQAATQSARFVFVAALIGEVFRTRSFPVYALIGMAVAMAGFALLVANEGPSDTTILNSYAAAAYLTTGFVGGFVYWLFAGRWSGSRPGRVRMENGWRSPPDGRRPGPARGEAPSGKRPRLWSRDRRRAAATSDDTPEASGTASSAARGSPSR